MTDDNRRTMPSPTRRSVLLRSIAGGAAAALPVRLAFAGRGGDAEGRTEPIVIARAKGGTEDINIAVVAYDPRRGVGEAVVTVGRKSARLPVAVEMPRGGIGKIKGKSGGFVLSHDGTDYKGTAAHAEGRLTFTYDDAEVIVRPGRGGDRKNDDPKGETLDFGPDIVNDTAVVAGVVGIAIIAGAAVGLLAGKRLTIRFNLFGKTMKIGIGGGEPGFAGEDDDAGEGEDGDDDADGGGNDDIGGDDGGTGEPGGDM